jgi:hypothetical protein
MTNRDKYYKQYRIANKERKRKYDAKYRAEDNLKKRYTCKVTVTPVLSVYELYNRS